MTLTRRFDTAAQAIAHLKTRVTALEKRRPRELIVDEDQVTSTSQDSLPNQVTHEVVLTKTFSNLNPDFNYRLHAWYGIACSLAIDGATNHNYQVAIRLDGVQLTPPALVSVPTGQSWTMASGSGVVEFTGETSVVLTATAYSYAPDPGTGRVYYRHMSWVLRRVPV